MTIPVLSEEVRALIDRLLKAQPRRRKGQDVAFIYARCSSDPHGRGLSVERQVEDCWRDCERHGWWVGGIYVDNDRSASFAATKDREDFERMLADMQRSKVDVLVCWEASRATRDMRTYLDLADTSRELGVRWCFNGSMYDLTDEDDEFRATLDVTLSHKEVRRLSRRSRAGIAKAARDGKPHGGPPPYGYYRRYDERTGVLLGQYVDDVPRELVIGDRAVVYRPCEIAEDVITRIAGGDSCWGVATDLNDRGIPGPEGGNWLPSRVRSIAMNPVYAGWRAHRGEIVAKGLWDPIVDDDTHKAAVRALSDPKRKTTKTNKARYLLTYIAACGICAAPLSPGRKVTKCQEYMNYQCAYGVHHRPTIRMEKLDAYVEALIITRLSDPATLDWLVRPDDTDAAKAAERAVAKRAELAEWKAKAVAGRVAPDDFVDIAAGIREQIAELESAAQPEYIPVVLRGLIGEQAAQAWDALTLRQKRDVIRSIVSVRLLPVGGGRRRFDPARVKVTWLLDAQPVDPAAVTG